MNPPPHDDEIWELADLRYSQDSEAGYTRVRRGKGFSYHATNGARLRSARTLKRIQSLVIPPAWTGVWICPDAHGHLQVTGFDERGRKQYLYHPRWREVRDAIKFDGILDFAEALPRIRARVDVDVRRRGLGREKVLAAVVWLLEDTLIRVGNAEYARMNASYGLTTMRRKHVEVVGADVRFRFVGKSGKAWNLATTDRRIARVVQQCSDLPGYELFAYKGADGTLVDVTSTDVNAYLSEICGGPYTAKDFRTWAGTVLAAVSLATAEPATTERERTRSVAAAMKQVAKRLGNTPATCRKSYVHPTVISAYLLGETADVSAEGDTDSAANSVDLSPNERAVLHFLRARSLTE